jgi:two-component system sensor kinase FixL
MADEVPGVSSEPRPRGFARERIRNLLDDLERLAAGDTQTDLPISPLHDELDAIAFAVNSLVSELRFAHARLTESERVNFATAFHSNPCGMAIVRVSDGQFQDVNAAFERQTGFSRGEVVNRTVHDLGVWIDPDDVAVVARKIWSGGRFGGCEVRFRDKRGQPSICVCSAEIITFQGDPCVLAAGLDVTDRKHAETQAAALREELAHLGRVTMLDALTGSLAHEINQPLTAVMANTEAALQMVAASPIPLQELRETLNDIRSDNKRAGDVVWRMAAMLKKGSSKSEALDLHRTVGDVISLVQSNAIGRRISLEVQLDAGIVAVRGDRIQIQQVVLNLLMNAFDAVATCPAESRRVRIQTIARDGAAVIEVSDCGPGLSDDALASIFEPFYTTKRQGLGLGLWICRGIVTAHGGTLDARCNPERGMTFSTTLPAERAGDETRGREEQRRATLIGRAQPRQTNLDTDPASSESES